MNPLKMVITAETEDPQQRTLCGIFNPASLPSEESAKKFQQDYSWELWHLFDHRGKTLGEACDSAEGSYRLERLMKTVEELFDIGAIEVIDGRIVLRRELPSPLEWLARCAD